MPQLPCEALLGLLGIRAKALDHANKLSLTEGARGQARVVCAQLRK